MGVDLVGLLAVFSIFFIPITAGMFILTTRFALKPLVETLAKALRESGYAHLIYPLTLAPKQTLSIDAEHLFHSFAGRDLVYLNSLEPAAVNHAAILQVSVGREESHTARIGREFHLTDFRPHFRDVEGRSASASRMTFLSYKDGSGADQRLVGKRMRIIDSGPAVIEYTSDVESSDGKIAGTVRVWQPATSDMTRIFSEVDLRVTDDVHLSTSDPAPLFFTRYEVGNPMVYREYAFRDDRGRTMTGPLPWGGDKAEVVANGTAMSAPFFLSMYRASNYGGKDRQGDPLTISDRAGNPLMAVFGWDVHAGDGRVMPGVYAFGSGPSQQWPKKKWYRRSIAAVPSERLRTLPAGSRIRYRAVHVTGGDEHTTAQLAERELAAWATGEGVRVSEGQLLSDYPIHVRASKGRAALEIVAGHNWIPVRVSGLASLHGLEAFVQQGGSRTPVGADSPDAPWHNAWPDGRGAYGITFLVRQDHHRDARVQVNSSGP